MGIQKINQSGCGLGGKRLAKLGPTNAVKKVKK